MFDTIIEFEKVASATLPVSANVQTGDWVNMFCLIVLCAVAGLALSVFAVKKLTLSTCVKNLKTANNFSVNYKRYRILLIILISIIALFVSIQLFSNSAYAGDKGNISNKVIAHVDAEANTIKIDDIYVNNNSDEDMNISDLCLSKINDIADDNCNWKITFKGVEIFNGKADGSRKILDTPVCLHAGEQTILSIETDMSVSTALSLVGIQPFKISHGVSFEPVFDGKYAVTFDLGAGYYINQPTFFQDWQKITYNDSCVKYCKRFEEGTLLEGIFEQVDFLSVMPESNNKDLYFYKWQHNLDFSEQQFLDQDVTLNALYGEAVTINYIEGTSDNYKYVDSAQEDLKEYIDYMKSEYGDDVFKTMDIIQLSYDAQNKILKLTAPPDERIKSAAQKLFTSLQTFCNYLEETQGRSSFMFNNDMAVPSSIYCDLPNNIITDIDQVLRGFDTSFIEDVRDIQYSNDEIIVKQNKSNDQPIEVKTSEIKQEEKIANDIIVVNKITKYPTESKKNELQPKIINDDINNIERLQDSNSFKEINNTLSKSCISTEVQSNDALLQ